MILLHGGFFECPIHAVYLAIGPAMVGFGKPMVNAMLMADAIEDMAEGRCQLVACRHDQPA
jgi:hypothetical protein